MALVSATAACLVAGLLPFWLADRQDLLYSLVTYRSSLPISGGSLWFALRAAPWAGAVRAGDTWIFLGAAVVLCAGAVAHRGGSLAPPRIHGLLAVAALCVPMLAKTSWPYYLLDPCVFATIWWLARPSGWWSWRMAPPLVIAIGGAVLGGVEQSLPLAAEPGAATGIATSAAIAAMIALILADRAIGPSSGSARGSGGAPLPA